MCVYVCVVCVEVLPLKHCTGSSGIECHIEMIEDAEIASDCLHISSGTLDIPVAKEASKRFLVLYLKHLSRFTEIEISVVDDDLVRHMLLFCVNKRVSKHKASWMLIL